ncbi:MAG: hypothetical protein E6005_03840 [Peptostreptococcus sp.]|uniref:phage scaffolding protein n=1 Tax=Peptostreptococcus sp. TaxID=1262 RepID=UPI002914CE8E|nr:hypothetical protein [Peptostreptococcus sp.]MDU5681004.1 hypothetical protein [Peptostreptococcus sp.]MDU5737923.1 hypothetical protein [Peptostreptococcus sp.]
MKREFLKNLELEDDVIDKIMAEHGKTTKKYLDKIDAKDTELGTLQGELKDVNDKLKSFDGIDIDKLKSEAEDWKGKYEGVLTDNAINDYFKDTKFTSDLARKATIAEFKEQKFELKDGKFTGADEFMEKFKKENETAFVKDGAEPNKPPVKGFTPAGTGGADPSGGQQPKSLADAIKTKLSGE